MTPLLVMVTVASAEEGERIARALVEGRWAACVNRMPGLISTYWWQGKVEQAQEQLLLIKSSQELWEPLQRAIRALHSYECPEIVALSPAAMAPAYAAWWAESISAMKKQLG